MCELRSYQLLLGHWVQFLKADNASGKDRYTNNYSRNAIIRIIGFRRNNQEGSGYLELLVVA